MTGFRHNLKNKGFTLIEMIVGMAVFLLIIGVALTIFLAIISHQRQILAEEKILNQVSYIEEYMSKALRMVSPDDAGQCIKSPTIPVTSGSYYQLTRGGAASGGFYQGIRFVNHSDADACTEFFLDNGVLKELKGTTTIPDDSNAVALTSADLKINYIRFGINGTSGCVNLGSEDCPEYVSKYDALQPRVTILMSIEIPGTEQSTEKIVQTTISARNLNASGVSTVCRENWKCTDWGECLENSQTHQHEQTRTCIDQKTCNTIFHKPAETQTCDYVRCTQDINCGTPAFSGAPYCQPAGSTPEDLTHVYKDYTDHFCENPGTFNSFCTSSTTAKPFEDCGSHICSAGACLLPACSSDAECENPGLSETYFCGTDTDWLYKNTYTWTCNNPGAQDAYCTNTHVAEKSVQCASTDICLNGACVKATCKTDSDCGEPGLSGTYYCGSNPSFLYQYYYTHTCNTTSPGTCVSTPSATTQQSVDCTQQGFYTCSNGAQGAVCACNSNWVPNYGLCSYNGSSYYQTVTYSDSHSCPGAVNPGSEQKKCSTVNAFVQPTANTSWTMGGTYTVYWDMSKFKASQTKQISSSGGELTIWPAGNHITLTKFAAAAGSYPVTLQSPTFSTGTKNYFEIKIFYVDGDTDDFFMNYYFTIQ